MKNKSQALNLLELALKSNANAKDYFLKYEKLASTIYLFGSHINQSNSVDSDVDFLFVGEGKSFHSTHVDAKWIKDSKLHSKKNHGSK